MTYKPQKGDRVRVVIEGEVTRAHPNGAFDVDHRHFLSKDSSASSVEKLSPPLPTTPGSVVRQVGLTADYFYTLHTDGKWYGRTGTPIAPASLPGAPEVIFDAGAR